MNAAVRDMHMNLLKLRKVKECNIISKFRYGFSAELKIRDGKYKIRIDYRVKNFPKVYLLEPEIDMSQSLEIHTFGLKFHGACNRKVPLLCLTYHGTDKWKSTTLLTDSYIPWAIEWTEFYEIWLLTGVWYGGGVHPREDSCNEKSSKSS